MPVLPGAKLPLGQLEDLCSRRAVSERDCCSAAEPLRTCVAVVLCASGGEGACMQIVQFLPVLQLVSRLQLLTSPLYLIEQPHGLLSGLQELSAQVWLRWGLQSGTSGLLKPPMAQRWLEGACVWQASQHLG